MAEAPSTARRRVEIFSAGCPTCEGTIEALRVWIDPGHDIVVHDMHDGSAADQAEALGIRSVPAVVVDGSLLACCRNRGPSREELVAAGLAAEPAAD